MATHPNLFNVHNGSLAVVLPTSPDGEELAKKPDQRVKSIMWGLDVIWLFNPVETDYPCGWIVER